MDDLMKKFQTGVNCSICGGDPSGILGHVKNCTMEQQDMLIVSHPDMISLDSQFDEWYRVE